MIQSVKRQILPGFTDSDPTTTIYYVYYTDVSYATCTEGDNRFWEEVQEWVSQGNTITEFVTE